MYVIHISNLLLLLQSAENLSSMYQYHEMQQDRECKKQCLTHILLALMYTCSAVTADIDKALLCAENAVDVALSVRKCIVLVVYGLTHINMVVKR